MTDEQEISFGTTVVEMAERHQVEHLVYSSAIAAAYEMTGIPHFDTKVTSMRNGLSPGGRPPTICTAKAPP